MVEDHPPWQIGTHPFPVDMPRAAFRRRRQRVTVSISRPGGAELAERLRRFGLFSGLAAADLADLAGMASIHVYRAGETIWQEGMPNHAVLFIERGLAKTARRNRSGAYRTYGLYGPGDSMGIYAIWAGMKYPTDAVALSEGMTAILFEASDLTAFAGRHSGMAEALTVEIVHFAEAFIRKIEVTSAGTVAQRLATLMTLLIRRYGIALPDNTAHLPICLTLEHLGEIVDARIETMARVLGKWKRQGWLAIDVEGYHFSDLGKIDALLPG